MSKSEHLTREARFAGSSSAARTHVIIIIAT
jgi:hypothetical protein